MVVTLHYIDDLEALEALETIEARLHPFHHTSSKELEAQVVVVTDYTCYCKEDIWSSKSKVKKKDRIIFHQDEWQ